MTTANRASPRGPGRTPPFILVGLLLIVGFLAFSYWRLSSTNSLLAAELESVQIHTKDIDLKNAEVEKSLENTREELSATQGKLDQARKQLQDKDSEIGNLKADINSKQADTDKTKNLLSQCDTNVAEQKSTVETLKNEKAELEKQLNEAKQNHPVCDVAGCTAPIKEVLAVAAKLVGSDALGKVLAEAKFDAGKLLEGIQVPPPQQGKVEELNKDALQQQQGQNQQKPEDGKQQNPPVGTQVKNNSEVSSSNKTQTANVTGIPVVSDTKKSNDTEKTLIVESEKDKKVTDISNVTAQTTLEKQSGQEGTKAPKDDIENDAEDDAENPNVKEGKEHDGTKAKGDEKKEGDKKQS